MGFFDGINSYEDYKYVMADTSFLYVGVKYSYAEILENEEIPFKLRTITERYLLPETDPETTLESELYYMQPIGILYKTLLQLKCKVKFSRKKQNGSFETVSVKLEEFVSMSVDEKKKKQILIQELAVSKLSLMMFSV